MDTAPINRLSITSLGLSLLTVVAFCIGIAPIPLSDLVCYPSSFLLGTSSLVTGLLALWQIRSRGGQGRGFALAGAWIGAVTVIVTLCMAAITITVLPVVYDYAAGLWQRFRP